MYKVYNILYINIVMIPPDESKIEDIRFFLFIPNNLEEKIRSFADARHAIFKKFGIDLATKEKLVEHGLFMKQKSQ